LNGQRVGAIRVTDNPATYASDAANQPNEGQAEILTFPADQLVAGDNVLAVEVHQSGSSSSDVVFGLALGAVQAVTNSISATGTPLVLNEILARETSPTNAIVAGWVELYNPTTNAVSIQIRSSSGLTPWYSFSVLHRTNSPSGRMPMVSTQP